MVTIFDFNAEVGFRCPKCLNKNENTLSYVEADSSRDGDPKIEHLSATCNRCGGEWISKCADIDIEQEWEDLDLFTSICPKCTDVQVEMKLCVNGQLSGIGRRICDLGEEIDKEEHLHCKCEVCDFKWNSEVADKVKDSKQEEPKQEEEPRLTAS